MKKYETVQQYVLIMKELAAQGSTEESALISYIVDGIQDYSGNKMHLYESSTARELKRKFEVYQKIKSRPIVQVKQEKAANVSGKNQISVPSTKSAFRCYNCNLVGHRAADCRKPKRERGSCFSCNAQDHKLSDCFD